MTETKSLILTSLGNDAGSRTHLVETITGADTEHSAQMSADLGPVHVCSDFAEKTLLGAELSWDTGRGINMRTCH